MNNMLVNVMILLTIIKLAISPYYKPQALNISVRILEF